MRILVYGAGNIGTLSAALLKESGQDVSILARGERLAAIRDRGVQLEEVGTGKLTLVPVKAVETLDPDDQYDLVLVVLPKKGVSEVLPTLAANGRTSSFLFFGNNAAGPGEMIEALGRERVLLGFPGAGAVGQHHRRIRYLILSAREQPTTIGELNGSMSPRIEAIAQALEAAGFPVSICPNMDAWLKTHAAEIVPTVCALYMAGDDVGRLSRTPDALVLMLRAIREGYRVLAALGIPILPRSHRIFRWIPEPLLLLIMRRTLESDTWSVKVGHALDARDEMKTLAAELCELAERTGIDTPSLEMLSRHLESRIAPVPEESSQTPLE